MKTLIIKIKVFLNRYNPITITRVIKDILNRINYLDNENNKYHNELIKVNDKIFKLDSELSQDVYKLEQDLKNNDIKEYLNKHDEQVKYIYSRFNDFEIDNRDNLALCKRQDNKLNIAFTNDIKRCFEKINTLNTTMNKKFNALIDDDLQDSFYDFKEQHITPIKDDLKQVDINKRHIEKVETLLNELCELNQINEGNKDD